MLRERGCRDAEALARRGRTHAAGHQGEDLTLGGRQIVLRRPGAQRRAGLPTTAELLDILIGVGNGSEPDCRPPVDQSVFPASWGSLNWTQDGCMDLATGKVYGPECVDGPYGPPGFMCIRK